MKRNLNDIYANHITAVLIAALTKAKLLGLPEKPTLTIPLREIPRIDFDSYKKSDTVVFNFTLDVVSGFALPEAWKIKALVPHLSKIFNKKSAEYDNEEKIPLENRDNSVIVDTFYEKVSGRNVLVIQAVLDDGSPTTQKYIKKRLRITSRESIEPYTLFDVLKHITDSLKEPKDERLTNHQKVKLFVFTAVGGVAIPLIIVYQEQIRNFIELFILGIIALSYGLFRLNKWLSQRQLADFSLGEYHNTLGNEYMVEALVHFCNADEKYEKIKDYEDICDLEKLHDGINLKYHIGKKDTTPIDDEILELLRHKLVKRINNKLKNQFTRKIPTFDGFSPVIEITSIKDNGAEIEINVIVGNSVESRKRLAASRQQGKQEQKKAPTVDKKDEDF